MRDDETIMEMLCRILAPLTSGADRDELEEYLHKQGLYRIERRRRHRAILAEKVD